MNENGDGSKTRSDSNGGGGDRAFGDGLLHDIDVESSSFVNEDDGLNALLSNFGQSGEFFTFDEQEMMLSLNDVSDLPSSLIVTNIPPVVFVDEDSKVEFEKLFKQFDSDANFDYFRNFKRCRVNFNNPSAATMARLHCHQKEFKGGFIRCFFAQATDQKTPDENADNYLKLPALEKQFLISPPCSPPVGWEQSRESEPVVNFELLSRLASLATDNAEKVHELHSGTEDCPKIIIHTCGDEMDDDDPTQPRSPTRLMKIPQTRRPDFVSATGNK